MKKYLTIDEIQVGSWWARADSSHHGYCVTKVDKETNRVYVLDTFGEHRDIDCFKLQYRYYLVIPNKAD